jgi:hypothetical protein
VDCQQRKMKMAADCDFQQQKKLARAWSLASAYLALESRPGIFFCISLFVAV